MGDGGFRPAYNAPYATDTETQVIVGVEVTTAGSDMGQLVPMLDQVIERCGESPQQWLVDGGYPAHEQLDQAAEKTSVYAPVPKSKDEASNSYQPKPKDSKAVGEWRERMGSEEAKELYKDRAATAECVNALARERGLTRLRVRGIRNVRGVLLLHALAHNLMRTLALAPELLGLGSTTPKMAGASG
jgi:IS5 family transposase